MNKLKFIHHAEWDEKEWYEVQYEGVQVLTILRQSDFPFHWTTFDEEGKQCFETNKYRNDLFEEIEIEGDFG